jgi:hypothetical protein
VFLFSAVYPLAAFIALANNLTELWADRLALFINLADPNDFWPDPDLTFQNLQIRN